MIAAIPLVSINLWGIVTKRLREGTPWRMLLDENMHFWFGFKHGIGITSKPIGFLRMDVRGRRSRERKIIWSTKNFLILTLIRSYLTINISFDGRRVHICFLFLYAPQMEFKDNWCIHWIDFHLLALVYINHALNYHFIFYFSFTFNLSAYYQSSGERKFSKQNPTFRMWILNWGAINYYIPLSSSRCSIPFEEGVQQIWPAIIHASYFIWNSVKWRKSQNRHSSSIRKWNIR